jgi:ribosome-binding protein aMBF1 (putative translation factor)
MTNLFNRVKEAIDNGYEPLAMSAKQLAEDLQEKASDFAEDAVEDIQEAVAEVKKLFGKTND